VPKGRVALLFTLILAVSGFSGARYYTRRPVYSLEQLALAVRAQDQVKIERYLDMTASSMQLVDGFLAATKAEAVAESKGKADGLSVASYALGSAMVDNMKPMLATMVEREMRKALTTGVLDSASTADGPSLLRSVASQLNNANAQVFQGFGASVTSGDSASVDIRLRDADLDTTFTVVAALARADDHWRVVGIRNVEKVLVELDTVQALRLEHVVAPIREKMARAIALGDVTTSLRVTGFLRSSLDISVSVKNQGSGPVTWAAAKIIGPASGKKPYIVVLYSPTPLQVGMTAVMTASVDFNQFDEEHLALIRTPELFHAAAYCAILENGALSDTLIAYRSWADYRKEHPAK
jgi:hypothetical protein